MRLKIKERMRAWRRAALAPLNRSYGRIKRSIQSFIIKTVTMHGVAPYAKEASPVNNELLLALFKATQRPVSSVAPSLQVVSMGDGRLLAVHPLAGFMFVGSHDVTAAPQIALGSYQKRQTAALEHEVVAGSRVLHLHAGQGYHTLSLATLAGPDGMVAAVSLDVVDREFLELNVRAHCLQGTVNVFSTVSDALQGMGTPPDLVYMTEGGRLSAECHAQLCGLMQCNPELRIVLGARSVGAGQLATLVEEPLLTTVPQRLAA